MPKGQSPKQTVASMRAEVGRLYDKVDAYDAKVNSSMLLRIKRKLQSVTGMGSSERKSLLKKIDELDSKTITKKQQKGKMSG